MGKQIAVTIFVALLLFGAGCAPTNNNMKVPVGEEITMSRTSFSFDQDKAPYDLFSLYSLKPGDMLDVLFQIRTWVEKAKFEIAVDHTIDIRFVNAPELNQNQRVRPDGTISLPYLGIVRVVGMTVDELSKELELQYAKVLRKPELYVLVPEFRSGIKELKADLHTAPRGLSRLVTIRPDGYVTFPMVGDTYVAGKSIPEVNEHLNTRYEEILPGLHCDLFLEKHSGSVIYVVGEVNAPGSFSIVKPVSVVQAIALAGSTKPEAELEAVLVVRKHEDKLVAKRIDVQDTLDLTTAGALLYLQPDDIVIVPKTHLSRSAEVAQQISSILFFRGWSVSFGPDDF